MTSCVSAREPLGSVHGLGVFCQLPPFVSSTSEVLLSENPSNPGMADQGIISWYSGVSDALQVISRIIGPAGNPQIVLGIAVQVLDPFWLTDRHRTSGQALHELPTLLEQPLDPLVPLFSALLQSVSETLVALPNLFGRS